jgi:hypothetical protein
MFPKRMLRQCHLCRSIKPVRQNDSQPLNQRGCFYITNTLTRDFQLILAYIIIESLRVTLKLIVRWLSLRRMMGVYTWFVKTQAARDIVILRNRWE